MRKNMEVRFEFSLTVNNMAYTDLERQIWIAHFMSGCLKLLKTSISWFLT